MKNKWTGERLETFVFGRDSIEHLHRYAIVDKYIEGKIVLDIASGEGYGSNLMSDRAAYVYGVDIDYLAIQEAKIKYKKENLEFLVGSTSDIPIKDNTVDVVVSFETLEHHDKHHEMMIEINRVLKPNGILIISTPDKKYYSDKRNSKNEYHIKELYKDDFILLISNYFTNKQLLLQKYNSENSIIFNDQQSDDIIVFSGDYTVVNKIEIDALYLILIASNSFFKVQKTTIFDGSKLIKKDIDNRIQSVYNSNSYKIGTALLFPFTLLKKLFK